MKSLVSVLFLAGSLRAAEPLLIRDVTIVDGAHGARVASVLVRDGRIAALGADLKAPEGARVVEARGKYLIPGLWDMHLHLTMVESQAVSRDILLPLLVAHGIVGVRDMGGDLERLAELRREVAAGRPGPRILTPGPFLDGPQPPSKTVLPVATEEEARQAVRTVKERGAEFAKVQAGLTEKTYLAIAGEARRLSFPFAGHVPEALSAFLVARSGQRSIEHISPVLPGDAGLFFACSSEEEALRKELLALGEDAKKEGADRKALVARQFALQRRLVISTDPAKSRELFALLKKNGVRVVPTLIFGKGFAPLAADDVPADAALEAVPAGTLERWRKRRQQVIANSGAEDFERRRLFFDRSRELVGAMHRAGVALMAGSDAIDAFVVPGLSLHQELELFVASGLTPLEALRTATLEPARFLGEEKTRGTVEKGKAADLVLLEADPLREIAGTRKIAAVVLGGRYLPREELDKLLAAAVETAKKL